MQHVLGFLGFYYTYISNATPTLMTYKIDLHPGFTSFISYLNLRKVGGKTMEAACQAALRVLYYLRGTPPTPYTLEEERVFQQQVNLLENLKYQVAKIIRINPNTRLDDWDEGPYKDVSELIAKIENIKHKFIEMCRVSLQHWLCRLRTWCCLPPAHNEVTYSQRT